MEKTKKLVKSIKDIEKLVQIMKTHHVDSLQIEGISLLVTKHDYAVQKTSNKEKLDAIMSEEDLLFHSA